MYERGEDMKLAVGSISAYPSNLSICCLENKNITYGCVIQKTQVHTVSWDSKNGSVSWDSINISDTSIDKSVDVLQAALVLPNVRTYPLLVVGTTTGTQIFDIRTQKLLHQQSIDKDVGEPEDCFLWDSFCRGITCNDNFILVGTSFGHIIQFQCNGETSISTKKCLKEHSTSIADMATCRYDEITCSGDCSGGIIVWNKCFKGVQLKIATQHPINVMNVLRKQVVVGTLRGRVLFFSISGGELISEVFAHARPITCISVAPESAYVLSGSEDGRFIVYKLHTLNTQTYQVEYRYCDELPNCAIMGAQFTNGRGSNIAVACFDRNVLYGYRMIRKKVS